LVTSPTPAVLVLADRIADRFADELRSDPELFRRALLTLVYRIQVEVKDALVGCRAPERSHYGRRLAR
jgi:hypothetical protein